RYAVSIQHLIAQFAGPGLIQRYHRGEQKGHPDQASRDMARFFCRGIKRKTEDHDHKKREKQHRVYGIFGSPLQTQIFGERVAGVLEGTHCAPLDSAAGVVSSRLRFEICPAAIQTNSTATRSSRAA